MPIARETIARAGGNERHELVFVVDDRLDDHTVVNGHRVIGVADFLAHDADHKYFNIAIADSRTRERLAGTLVASGIIPFNITAANAVTFDGNVIGEGAILCPFAAVTSNARIGRFFHGNLYSYVAHDVSSVTS
jgi:hypothetical protein